MSGYPPAAMRADKAAEYIGVSKSTFFRMIADDKLPAGHKVGGCVIWRRDELERALDRLTGVQEALDW